MQNLLTEEFLAPYYKKVDVFPTLISRVTYLSKYCRNGEGWTNTIKRCVLGNVAEDPRVTQQEAEKLFHAFWTMQALPPGRGLWVGGVQNLPVEGRYNCYYVTIRGVSDWGWAMGMLMVGGGVGVGLQDLHLLPVVKRSDNANFYITCRETHPDYHLVKPDNLTALEVPVLRVEDSREGWVWASEKTIEYAFEGKSLCLDVSGVRERGAPLKTFGGYASGPSALVDMLRMIYGIIRSAQGRKLMSVEGLDITNLIGKCVKAGSVRRSAIIQLGEFTDLEFRNAKKDYEKLMSHRHTSNNSIVFREYSEMENFNWRDLVEDNVNYGEPGFLNLAKARETDHLVEGVNPCQPAWATVLTPDGISTVGDIKEGDTIWSGKQWTKVLKKWSTGIKKVHAYRTAAGTFYGTENHRVVSGGEKIEVSKASKIDVSPHPNAPGVPTVSHQIQSVQFISEEEVFDLTVEADEHTYWTDGLLVSNCGEQTLEHRESCNLAEVFPARFDGSLDERTVFKLITRYCIRQRVAPVKDEIADVVRRKNNRIGVGLGGICDFRYSRAQLSRWYVYCREEANNYATSLNMAKPKTVTTVKPSGTLSLLCGSSPGIHADYDHFYMRRMTLGPDEPMTAALIDAGVPYEVSMYDKTGRDLSFMFPSKLLSPMGITKKTQTVQEQLERQLLVQQAWADNAVSSTIEFNDNKDEMLSLADALKLYAPQLKSVSLLSRGHSYPQAPYESIDEATFVKMASGIDSNHPLTLENAGKDYASFEEECKNGVCPTR